MNAKKKENKQFMILSALAIIFVVDAHAWSPLAIFTHFFPYNSFFMPLFVFISGYFFSEKHLEKVRWYVGQKAKRLLLPYYIILFCNIVIAVFLRNFVPIGSGYGTFVTLDEFLVNPFFEANLSYLFTPGWFAPALFCVLVVWIFIRYILRRLWNDYVATIVCCIIGAFCVYLAKIRVNDTIFLPLIRTGFLMQFYQIGVLYRLKLEEKFRKVPALVVLLTTIVINTFLQYYTNNQIYFNDINIMSGFLTDIYVLPLITSITGISFWLVIADKLVPVLGENKLINYISGHTYSIMMFHILWFNVYNFLISRIPSVAKNFDFERFYHTAWYRYEPTTQMRVMYTIVGLFGSVAMCWCVEKLVSKVRK